MEKADIGVIGGSGFYSLLAKSKSISLSTPYGAPSAKFTIGKVGGKKVVFLPRHGTRHEFPPHKIPYLANIYGFKKLGVKFIISPCAVGSLKKEFKPGDFVVGEQIVDRTKNRPDTFYDGPKSVHMAFDKPYCSYLRHIALSSLKKLKYSCHRGGIIVVINGPRFSTQAESEWYRKQNWELINMTQYPEAVLARELEICFVNISVVTDYDTGFINNASIKPVTFKELIANFNKVNEKLRTLIFEMINQIDVSCDCSCHHALEPAMV